MEQHHTSFAAPAEAPPFTSLAEEDAYWAGVADGIRNGGGIVPPRLAARAAKERLLDPDPPLQGEGDHAQHGGGAPQPASPPRGNPLPHASAANGLLPGEDRNDDTLAFSPVPVRPRHDGWTPERQVAFVEALADCGIVRQAAAEVGMTEQSVGSLRRRADARAFNRACDAALALGARRLVSIAYERAIEGTIRRRYYHGEVIAEERVHDNRLLIALINKLPDLHPPAEQVEDVAGNWDGWMEAITTGQDAPPAPPPLPEAGHAPVDPAARNAEVWEEEDGTWLTNAMPPEDFDGEENGEPADRCYERTLTEEEQEWWDAEVDDLEPVKHFGMSFYPLGRAHFLPWGSERTTSSEPSGPSNPTGEEVTAPA